MVAAERPFAVFCPAANIALHFAITFRANADHFGFLFDAKRDSFDIGECEVGYFLFRLLRSEVVRCCPCADQQGSACRQHDFSKLFHGEKV